MTIAAEPSETAQQSKRPNGQEIMGALTASATVIGRRKWALGWAAPFLWFLTATLARSSLVQPHSWKARLAAKANMAGALAWPSTGWMGSMGMPPPPWSSNFSTPQATTTSYTPAATAKQALR